MDNAYIEDEPGHWEPAVPLPLYAHGWFGTRKRYICVCRGEFRTEKAYEDHYRGWHITSGTAESG